MNDPRPPSRRIPGSPIRRSAPQPPSISGTPRSGPGAVVWIAIGLCAVVGIGVAVVAVGGKKSPDPGPVVTAPPPSPPKPSFQVPVPPPFVPAPVPPVQPPAPPPAPKRTTQDPVEARKAELAALAKQRRTEGEARLAEARAEVQKDLEREQQEAKAFERRFADLRLDVKLTSKQEYKQAAITGFTPDELRIRTGREEAVLPWSIVDPETVVAVAKYVYRGEAPEDLLALARFYVDRRLWKEAQSALHRLKRVDEEQTAMADKFDEAAAALLTGKGPFQGAHKTTGATGLRLSYDFSDPSQGDDFKGHSRGLSVENGKMTLESEKSRLWSVGDLELEFWEEVDFDATVSVQGELLVAFHHRPGQDWYIVELGPAGTALKKGRNVDSAKDLARNANAALKGNQKVRVSIRRRRVSVSIGGRPALAFEDPASDGEARGRFQIGVSGGKAVFSPGLVVDGQANPDYLRKKIGTIEMEARRSVSKDLGDIRELNAQQMADRILGAGDEGISADMLSLEFLSPQELPLYQDIKQFLAGRLSDPGRVEKAQAAFEEWQEKRPGFPSIWYLKGIRYFNQFELVEARDCFEKAVGLFPQFFEAHYQIARTWWYAREFAKALDACAKALEIRPDYANAHVLTGQMLFAKDKKASMEADFTFRLAEKLDADAAQMLHERRRVRLVTRGPRDLGCIYELESAHYQIVTDISAERAAWYASQLEVVRASYLDAFKKWYGGDSRPKPRIAIFNTREAFYTYTELGSTERRENLLGFFDPANNELVLFEDLDLEETLQVLYHEAFHHFASAMLKFPPYWWNEGIAEYMSAVKLDPQGKEIKERARILGRLTGMKMALAGDFFIPFEKIMNYSPAQFYSGMVGLHYAQAWTMIHFLYEFEKGRHRHLIEQYFDELVKGRTQRQAYDAVFAGKTEALEKEWLKFTKALKPPKK